MNKKVLIKCFLLGTIFITGNMFANEKVTPANSDAGNQIQKVIDEYKDYLSSIPPATREEIIDFRKKIAAINKEKSELFAGLSQAAQDYLSKTKGFKQKLPIRQRGLINIENPGQISSPQKGESKNSSAK